MKRLRLTYWHLGIWLLLAALAGGAAVRTCLVYNSIAGTDKTPGHIALIAAAMMGGPMVGPIANPAATGIRSFTFGLTLALFCGILLTLSPFVFVKRHVSTAVWTAAWSGFLVATCLWYLAALLSLGIHLS